jgi:hypothetical protein
MNLSPKYIVTGVVFLIAFFGYNAFLIQRDQKLFDAYYGPSQEQLK